jgi:hypothetical protein
MLGRLDLAPALEAPELLAPPVLAAPRVLSGSVGVPWQSSLQQLDQHVSTG